MVQLQRKGRIVKIGDVVGVRTNEDFIEESIIVDLNYREGRRSKEKIRVFVIPRLVYEEVDIKQLTKTPSVPRMLPQSITPRVLLEYLDRSNPALWIRNLLGRQPLVFREVEEVPKWQRRTRRIRVQRRRRQRR